MRKIICLALACCLALALCGCVSTAVDYMILDFILYDPNYQQAPAPSAQSGQMPEVNTEPYNVTYTSVWTAINTSGMVMTYVMAEVENTSDQTLYFAAATYDLEDSEGKLVYSEDSADFWPQFLQPGEKGYVYTANCVHGVNAGEKLNVNLRLYFEWQTAAIRRFPVSEFSMEDDGYGDVRIKGRVTNELENDQGWIDIAAIAFDKDEKPICVLEAEVREPVKPGDTIGFTGGGALPANLKYSDIASYKVYAFCGAFQF